MSVLEFQNAKVGMKVRIYGGPKTGKITSFGYLNKGQMRTQVQARRNVATANGAYVQQAHEAIAFFYRYSELEFV